MTDTDPTVGEAIKAKQMGNGNGDGATLSVKDILERAPKDIVQEPLFIPEWDGTIQVRSLTAAQQAVVKQLGLTFKGDETNVAWAEMEIQQFMFGVAEPNFADNEVRQLHATSGRGFARVIDWIDKKSGMDKEELRKTRDEFQDANN